MRTPFRAASIMFFMATLVFVPSISAQPGKLIGVWKITEARIVPPEGRNQESRDITNYRPGIIIFTRNHFSWVDSHGQPLPNLQEEDPNVAYFAAAFNQLTDFSGSYEAKGSSVTVSVIVSKMPDILSENSSLKFEYEFEGDVLVLRWHTPKNYSVTFKLERLE
jgi:hypothetical protein